MKRKFSVTNLRNGAARARVATALAHYNAQRNATAQRVRELARQQAEREEADACNAEFRAGRSK